MPENIDDENPFGAPFQNRAVSGELIDSVHRLRQMGGSLSHNARFINSNQAGELMGLLADEPTSNAEAVFNDGQARREQREEAMNRRIAQSSITPNARGLYMPQNLRRSSPRVTDNSKCIHCGTHFDKYEEGIDVGGSDICGRCQDVYLRCDVCDRVIHAEEAFQTIESSGYSERVCNHCRQQDYINCFRCGGLCSRDVIRSETTTTLDVRYFCPLCPQETNQIEPMPTVSLSEDHKKSGDRIFAKHKGWCEKGKGEIVDSERIWSAEIECISPSSAHMKALCLSIPKEMGISNDSSISAGGKELQTPMIQGRKGESLVKHVCKKLQGFEFTTDKTCGLHIHLDKGSVLIPSNPLTEDPVALKNLWGFCLAFEDVILSVLPQSRRTNRFCRKMRQYFHLQEVKSCSSLDGLEKVWYRSVSRMDIQNRKKGKYDESRYAGFNFHSLLGSGHFEVRYHSGTLSSKKILEWANLFCKIMDWADSPQASWSVIEAADELFDPSEKRAYMYKLLNLKQKSIDYLESRAKLFLQKDPHTEDSLITNE